MKAMKVSAVAVCMVMLLASCNSKKTQSESTTENTKQLGKLASVKVESVDQLQVYTATIEGDVKNNIAPAAPSRIDKIFVEVGDNVRKDQKLVQMDEASLKQMELQIKNMEVEFNRIDQLYKVGGVSKAEWDNMNLQLEVNKSAYKTLLENTQLLSPIDGVVTARNYDNGDLYSGQPVLVVQRISPVKLTINISEQYFSKVSKGDVVTVELDAYPGEKFSGKVSLIYPTVDANTHTFPAEIMVSNSNKKLRPGMFARATLNLGTENHVVVPDLAIVKRAGSGDRFVYVYKDGKVKYVKVELGQRLGDRYELISGISTDAQVVISAQSHLTDGAEVELEKK
jgi:RND family efflux transporter MFP subunit